MRYLRVKNWERFNIQSKKRLPWIKLFTELLEPTRQPEYSDLSDVSKLHLLHVWLLARVFDGRIPEDWLNERILNIKSRLSLDLLIDSGYVFFETESIPKSVLGLDSLTRATRALDSVISTSPSLDSTGVDFSPVLAFNQIWPEYPRRIGRKAAYKHFLASVSTAEEFALCRSALANYRAEVKDRKQEFIKHGDAWFNNWRDWVDSTTSKPRAVLSESDMESRIEFILDTVAMFESAGRNPSDPQGGFNATPQPEIDEVIGNEPGETRWEKWVNFCEKRGMSPVRKTA